MVGLLILWLSLRAGASPGRFFAVNEIKALLAHVLINYDVKFEDDRRVPPAPIWYGWYITPNSSVEVMFRERVVEWLLDVFIGICL